LDIHFIAETSCERAAPLAEKNAAARHHALRNLISLHNKHRVFHSHGLRFTNYYKIVAIIYARMRVCVDYSYVSPDICHALNLYGCNIFAINTNFG
jgi:hypothetical protein